MTAQVPYRQQGAVLIVALIFLVILTMLGVTAMTGTTMETRMANNARDVGIATHAAEAAIRDAEMDIDGGAVAGQESKRRQPPIIAADFGVGAVFATCNTGIHKGLCLPRADAPYPSYFLPQDLLSVAGINLSPPPIVGPSVGYGDFTGAAVLKVVSQQPRYLIEVFCSIPSRIGSLDSGTGSPCKYYRITARGYGGNPNSRVTLSEVYAVP